MWWKIGTVRDDAWQSTEGPWSDRPSSEGVASEGVASEGVASPEWPWHGSAGELEELQVRLAAAAGSALAADPWVLSGAARFGGCFVVHRRGVAGPGRAGDRVWAAAVVWERPAGAAVRARRADRHLRGAAPATRGHPRQADDVLAQAVLSAEVPAPYRPGLLAAREGAVLAGALAALGVHPDVVLVDASGLDHPRHAGLAVHLGAATGMPTVGVTRRPMVASGLLPELHRGARSPLLLDGRCVAYWVCTKDGVQPVVAHAGWRTSPETSVGVLLEASTPAARTPVPLQEARRVAREARSLADRR